MGFLARVRNVYGESHLWCLLARKHSAWAAPEAKAIWRLHWGMCVCVRPFPVSVSSRGQFSILTGTLGAMTVKIMSSFLMSQMADTWGEVIIPRVVMLRS